MLPFILVTYFVLLGVLAIVSAMETATFSVRDAGERLARLPAGSLRDYLATILANPFHHVHRTLLVSAALNLALVTIGLYLIFEPLRDNGFSPWVTAPMLFGFTVLLGDVLPKFIAIRAPATILIRTTRLLHPLRRILDPLATWVENAADHLLKLVVPKRIKVRQNITRDELETLIDMRCEQGAIDESEAAILNEVIDISDLTVRDCMEPRVDLTMVEAAKPAEVILNTLERSPNRFVILYGDTPDTVLGVVDIYRWKTSGRPAWKTMLQPPVFVPETYSALDALTKHLTSPTQCLLISDEYGGLEGMVTQEEIVDWLLYDAAPWQGETPELRALDEDESRYIADGSARVDDINDALDIELDAPGIDTIGGFVFNHLGYLPKPGERLKLPEVEIKVRRISRRRIQQVELRVLKDRPSANDSQPLTEQEEEP